MGFVGNYAPRGLSPQTDGMPVILKKAPMPVPSTVAAIAAFVLKILNIFIFLIILSFL